MHPVNRVALINIAALVLKTPIFQAINLRSLSFLPESISVLGIYLFQLQGHLLVATFIWIRLCASFPAVQRNQGISDNSDF